MQGVTLNGNVTHFRDEGAGFPVVFANSLGTDLRVWDRLTARLAALLPSGLRMIRYDKRGHGLTGAPPAPYRMDALVADAACSSAGSPPPSGPNGARSWRCGGRC